MAEEVVKSENMMEEEDTSFSFESLFKAVLFNWVWYVLSVLICLGVAAIYLRYTTPIYKVSGKFVFKDDTGRSYRSRGVSFSLTGEVNNTGNFDTEMEILCGHAIAVEAVRDLKLYVNYKEEGRIKNRTLYKTQPITVDIDSTFISCLPAGTPINLTITKTDKGYHVEGTYSYLDEDFMTKGPFLLSRDITTLPASIKTNAGMISFLQNPGRYFDPEHEYYVSIQNPSTAAAKYMGGFSATPSSKTTSIAMLTETDENINRAIDYVRQVAVIYNRQANNDKNEIASRTEAFINDRMAKISEELGSTEGAIEQYKKQNQIGTGSTTGGGVNALNMDQELRQVNVQMEMLNSLNEHVNNPANKYKTLPTGMAPGAQDALINQYNTVVMERNRLLQTASENSPVITPLNQQLDEIMNSIKQAFNQSRRELQIQRDAAAVQYGRAAGALYQSPTQERTLTEIGRQQDVKSGLYLMLLQKREENSISLAATADKGKLLDDPSFVGQIAPNADNVFYIAMGAGFLIPTLILLIINFFRYRIEGHDDVAQLTKLPILADVAVASEAAKGKADIVVHENKNSQMEEVFRSMRTNLLFMLEEGQKVVMFTSSTSGEGKTFNAANLSMSFALLGKKVCLCGLDIRKPRLGELFDMYEEKRGISPLLTMETPTWEQLESQVLPSGLHANLDLLLAGPVPPNPAELLARKSLEIVFNHLRDHYDLVIVDTAPVGLVTDTLEIARVCDATIYMCRADYTPKAAFGLINALANDNKLPKVAVVINGIDMSKKKYGYYYGYGRYGKYGRYGQYRRYARYGYGRYGHYGYGRYGKYGSYGYGSHYGTHYGTYGKYGEYGEKHDTSIKLK